MTALRIGTWVTGFTVTGIFGFPDHKGHLFKLEARGVKTPISNSGFVQDIRCLICGEYVRGVDGEFLKVRATTKDIQVCLDAVQASRTRLYRARRILANELVRGAMNGD